MKRVWYSNNLSVFKKLISIFLSITLMYACINTYNNTYIQVYAEENENADTGESEKFENTEDSEMPEITAPSAILMEASTGTVLCEKDADTPKPPASVTKIMTMLLIFDAVSEGKIHLEDEVNVSEYAASMGGSQVFLEPGETQTVDTMLKCIAVASANDACVSMAEYISGSEEKFVRKMNERAKGLGMDNTHFVNCNGLDAEGHVTSARDIALMSRELISKYPQIHDYSMIWMENITHKTSKGTSEFGLTNTNKLVRQYAYTTGLKTGSTGNAGFCVSATAEKDGIELIAVIMGAETSKDRFSDAVKLLNYGFGKCQIYRDEKADDLPKAEVLNGKEDTVSAQRDGDFVYVDTENRNLNNVERKISTVKEIQAPVKKGDVIGSIQYLLEGEEIGKINLKAASDVEKASFIDRFKETFTDVLL